MPPTRDDTAGTPLASASTITFGKPSEWLARHSVGDRDQSATSACAEERDLFDFLADRELRQRRPIGTVTDDDQSRRCVPRLSRQHRPGTNQHVDLSPERDVRCRSPPFLRPGRQASCAFRPAARPKTSASSPKGTRDAISVQTGQRGDSLGNVAHRNDVHGTQRPADLRKEQLSRDDVDVAA
jgi:hypothetical protein